MRAQAAGASWLPGDEDRGAVISVCET